MYEPEISNKVNETLSVKWDSGLKSFFKYNFKINDLISYKSKSGGDFNLAKVIGITESRIYVRKVNYKNPYRCENQNQNQYGYYSFYRRFSYNDKPFHLTPNDEVKRGYPLYLQKKEILKNDSNRNVQDNIDYKCDRINDHEGDEKKCGFKLKKSKQSKTILINKKVYEDENQVTEYVSAYASSSSFTKNSTKFKNTFDYNHSNNTNYIDHKDDVYDDGIDINSVEIKVLTEEEYQLLAEKLSYNRFLNQFIKQEEIDREYNNKNNKNNNKVKTFEISDKRVRRFALKYIKPEDLEKINSKTLQHNEYDQQQEYSHNSSTFEYNDQPYQEEVYYIEPEPFYNNDYGYEVNNYYEKVDNHSFSYYSEANSNNNNNDENNNNINKISSHDNSSINVFYQNNSIKQNQIFDKLIKDLNANNNQDYKEDYEKLRNTFESGYILQNEFHQRRMDLLRDYFNIDLSKYLIV